MSTPVKARTRAVLPWSMCPGRTQHQVARSRSWFLSNCRSCFWPNRRRGDRAILAVEAIDRRGAGDVVRGTRAVLPSIGHLTGPYPFRSTQDSSADLGDRRQGAESADHRWRGVGLPPLAPRSDEPGRACYFPAVATYSVPLFGTPPSAGFPSAVLRPSIAHWHVPGPAGPVDGRGSQSEEVWLAGGSSALPTRPSTSPASHRSGRPSRPHSPAVGDRSRRRSARARPRWSRVAHGIVRRVDLLAEVVRDVVNDGPDLAVFEATERFVPSEVAFVLVRIPRYVSCRSPPCM